MSGYNQAQARTALNRLGFRVRSTGELEQAVGTFQIGYNLGYRLAHDESCGLKTSAAIARSLANGGRASAHFFWREWQCTCGGRYSACRRILVLRPLLTSLEGYRAKTGPVHIISGYRCVGRNLEVKGASNSQHLYGSAADLNSPWQASKVAGLHLFGGIGKSGHVGNARHVDRRDVSGHNNGGSLPHPMVWTYTW